jgi:hypothetical protein
MKEKPPFMKAALVINFLVPEESVVLDYEDFSI